MSLRIQKLFVSTITPNSDVIFAAVITVRKESLASLATVTNEGRAQQRVNCLFAALIEPAVQSTVSQNGNLGNGILANGMLHDYACLPWAQFALVQGAH